MSQSNGAKGFSQCRDEENIGLIVTVWELENVSRIWTFFLRTDFLAILHNDRKY